MSVMCPSPLPDLFRAVLLVPFHPPYHGADNLRFCICVDAIPVHAGHGLPGAPGGPGRSPPPVNGVDAYAKELTPNRIQQARIHLFDGVLEHQLTVAQAAQLLGVTERHAWAILGKCHGM
jgi:hypothetical protein